MKRELLKFFNQWPTIKEIKDDSKVKSYNKKGLRALKIS